MSQDPQVQTPGVRLALRPGTQVFVISGDEVQVAAVNHSTTFTGIPVVRVVSAIAEAMAATELVAGPTRVELVAGVAEGLLGWWLVDVKVGTSCGQIEATAAVVIANPLVPEKLLGSGRDGLGD